MPYIKIRLFHVVFPKKNRIIEDVEPTNSYQISKI